MNLLLDATTTVHLYLFHVHVLFSIIFFVGVFLLCHWMTTGFSKEDVKRAAYWALGIGTVGVTLTIPFCLMGTTLLRG